MPTRGEHGGTLDVVIMRGRVWIATSDGELIGLDTATGRRIASEILWGCFLLDEGLAWRSSPTWRCADNRIVGPPARKSEEGRTR